MRGGRRTVKGFLRQLGRRGRGGAQMVRGGGVTSLFVRVEGSKYQVRHNTGVWALDAVRLCVGMEGGHSFVNGWGGGSLILCSFTCM